MRTWSIELTQSHSPSSGPSSRTKKTGCPAENQPIWWEAWLHTDLREQFQAATATLDILLKLDEIIEFPERDVVLAFPEPTT